MSTINSATSSMPTGCHGGGGYATAAAADASSNPYVADTRPTSYASQGVTLRDIAGLGLFTQQELQQIVALNLPQQDLDVLYQEAVAYMQSPQYQQSQQSQQSQQPAGTQPVTGTQPASTATPQPQSGATLAAIAALGVLTQEELAQVQSMNLSQADLDQLYQQVKSYAQQQRQGQGQGTAAGTQGQSTGSTSAKGWSKQWDTQFRTMMDKQGLDSATQLMVVQQLKSLGLGDADLQQALQYYSTAPDGIKELKTLDEQVRSGHSAQLKQTFLISGLAAAGVTGLSLLARSGSNFQRVLENVARAGAPQSQAIARTALEQLRNGASLRNAAPEVAAMLRSEGGNLSLLRNFWSKLTTNAAARFATPARALTRSELIQYATFMKTGDAAIKAGGATASAVAGAADDVARAGVGMIDDAARAGAGVAATGAAQAAKGASLLSKAGKYIGVAGIVLSLGLGAWQVKQTMDAEGGFGKESKKAAGGVLGNVGGGMAGAAAGAAIGSVVPVIGTGVGALVGGIIGGLGGGQLGEWVGSLF